MAADRFPYNMASREALVELIRRTEKKPNLQDRLVTFEDIFFAPTLLEPGRTYIEMEDLSTGKKDWYVYRRLNLSDPLCLGPTLKIKIIGDPSPASIATEVNRMLGFTFGPDDVSFSTDILPVTDNKFTYVMDAFVGSYAYFGSAKIEVEVIGASSRVRRLQDGSFRYKEDGVLRLLEDVA